MSDAGPVRAGEEIDLARLNAFLAPRAAELGRVVAAEQFAGGFSNLSYLLTTDRGELVLRRPPRGVAKGSAHDMAREFRVLSLLFARAIAVPRPILLCDDDMIIGSPFFLMERVRGTILRGTPREVPPASVMRALGETFIDTLIAIHALGPADAEVAALGSPVGYVMRQVGGWTARWERSRVDACPAMDRVAGWLTAHTPEQVAASVVHNDFKYDNLVLDPADLSRVRAVLDWEMATLGDPLLDVGTALGYWVEAGDHPAFRSLGLGATALPGNLTRTELWERYLECTGRPAVDPTFYYAFGLFKIAVIAQQIYFRFRRGVTADERFGRLGEAVQLLAATAEQAIARHSILPATESH